MPSDEPQTTSVVTIRPFVPGDALSLWGVFFASVHALTAPYYTAQQRAAWAPAAYPGQQWSARLQRNCPFVAELNGTVAGFADIQPDGYIDQFFIAPAAARRGIGTRLLQTLLATAQARRLPRLHAQVSLAAEPFFLRHGFVVDVRQQVEVRGETLRNARMSRRLLPQQAD